MISHLFPDPLVRLVDIQTVVPAQAWISPFKLRLNNSLSIMQIMSFVDMDLELLS